MLGGSSTEHGGLERPCTGCIWVSLHWCRASRVGSAKLCSQRSQKYTSTTFTRTPGVSPGAPGVRVPATVSTMISMFPGPSSVAVASTSRQPGSVGKGAGSPEGQGLWTGPRIPRLERGGGISNSSGHSPSISPVLWAGCESKSGSVITTDLCVLAS